MPKPFLKVGDLVQFSIQDWNVQAVKSFLTHVAEPGHYGSGTYRVSEERKDNTGTMQEPQWIRLVDIKTNKPFEAIAPYTASNWWNLWWFTKVS